MSNPTVEIKGATGTVFLTGRFTFDVQKAFKEAVNPLLDNPAIRTIAIDLSAASYMDSAALGILLLVREKATTHGKQMALRNANPTVLPILKLVKFDRLFETS
jgi:anti-anti-sigma factor